MTDKKIHNQDLGAKVELRKKMMENYQPGDTIFVPYCGFGELMDEVKYPPEVVIGIDDDRDAVDACREKWPDAKIILSDIKKFNWSEIQNPIGVADIDPYGSPWLVLENMLKKAPTRDKIRVCATDGSTQQMRRSLRPYNFQTHKFEHKSSLSALEQYQNYPQHIIKWLEGMGCAAKIIDQKMKNIMFYFLIEIEVPADIREVESVAAGVGGGGMTMEEFDNFKFETDPFFQ